MHYTCIACVTIDSVMRILKKTICKFIQKGVNIWLKKIQMSRFINTELKSDSDSEAESKSDTKLMGKFESASNNDSE